MRWYGAIGFANQVEDPPYSGVYKDEIVEYEYYGTVLQNRFRYSENSDSTISNVNLSNRFSIVSNAYANANIDNMRYIEHMGSKWAITDVDASNRPRLIISVGGLYNGG